ncbi:MAG: AAA family ATPase, partial [Proteobacteria bacterium]|nr:AAA family ATPase [Pseudomonadota bacterium]
MSQVSKEIPFKSMSESFTALQDKGMYYVDKTEFIPYLIRKGDEICVVTRPRRFGKTLMLRTLQTFFEYRLDETGNPVDNRRYFEGLKVMDAGDDVLKEMGQYPVISLSFKGMRNDSLEEMADKLRIALSSACDKHAYLLKEPALSDSDRESFLKILSTKESQSELEEALGRLCDWIYKATNRKTVILIDEYDVPLQQAAIYDIHHPGTNLFEKIVKLVGNFISSGFKSNSNLSYGIIAGCMRVAKESIFTGMNNPGVIDVTTKLPDEYWGFTDAEVKQMMAYYHIEDQYPEIERWYDGYSFGGRKVFNPWSLLNAMRGLVNGYGEDAIQPYWVLTSGNDIIDDVIEHNPQHREIIEKMMNGETARVKIYKNLSYRDLKQNPDGIWSFLLYTGYLKALSVSKNKDDLLEAEVTIPNTEVKTVIRSSLRNWWKNIKLRGWDAQKLLCSLLSGDVDNAERELRLVLCDSTSVFDYNEAFYHGMIVGLLGNVATVRS